jgi:hypothetical protein
MRSEFDVSFYCRAGGDYFSGFDAGRCLRNGEEVVPLSPPAVRDQSHTGFRAGCFDKLAEVAIGLALEVRTCVGVERIICWARPLFSIATRLMATKLSGFVLSKNCFRIHFPFSCQP